ncbi:MAG TPA: hypothetical protein ENH70_02470 [Desulfobacteraceae bacterium]|nr:MAG: hypothetical protein DRG82_01055 [Deltaproteobacteria bacterium]HDZ23386.1 hypothetical protein [Desulfobacteraceae bacterium]
MKKVHLLLPILLTGILLIPALPGFAFGGPGRYYGNHERRIDRGFRNGTITRGEYRHLQREQNHMRHATRRAWSDGYVTWRERETLVRMYRRYNRHAYWARHNRWVAPRRRPACLVAPLPHSRPVAVRYWAPEPQFNISGFIGDPSFALGWSFNLP